MGSLWKRKEDRKHRNTPPIVVSTGGERPWKKQYHEVLCMQPPHRQVISILVPAEGWISQQIVSATSTPGPFPSAQRQYLQAKT